jgi:sterol desaturase/sphingolipid hydroxylase (fatty acid hydroxylase superfamily)
VPTPFELLLDPVSLAVFAIYAGLMLWEKLAPARAWPSVRGWRLRGVIAFALFFLVSSYVPLWLAEPLGLLALLDASALGTLGGAALALLLYQALLYAWHRSLHESAWMFRTFHQLHHSAERLDTAGAFWFSPLDMLGFTLVSAVSSALLGITPAATTVFVLFATLLSIFQHTNVRTPYWLGYLVQRPESHSIHHARGVHGGNYADLPVFDLLFGTFRNPIRFAPEVGYYVGASERISEMLWMRDVTEPPERVIARGPSATPSLPRRA